MGSTKRPYKGPTEATRRAGRNHYARNREKYKALARERYWRDKLAGAAE